MRDIRGSLPLALLIVAGFLVSLLFHGREVEFFAVAASLLVIALAYALLRAYTRGVRVIRSSVSLAVGLFFAWLALTLLWTPVGYVSVLNFWWLSSLLFVFLAMQWGDTDGRVWRLAASGILVITIGLSLFGAYQFLIIKQQPRSVFINLNAHAIVMAAMALATAGALLASDLRGSAKGVRFALYASLLLLVFGLAVTKGRGATISFFVGLLLLIAVNYRRVPRRAWIVPLLIVGFAFAAADIAAHGQAFDRLATLANPESAAATRSIIWRQAWEMLKAAPFSGIGLGTFWLAFPAHRDPLDSSGGYYVHNDYLQFWLEAGLPALILLGAVLLSVLSLFRRVVQARDIGDTDKIEATGLFAALLAIAIHTFGDFDLYAMPILIGIGLALGRLQNLGASQYLVRLLKPARIFARASYVIFIGLVAATPVAYFAAAGLGSYAYDKAVTQVATGNLVESDKLLERAQRLVPGSDSVYMSRADLFRYLLSVSPSMPTDMRKRLFSDAMDMVTKAQHLNPLRPHPYYVRALLLSQNPDLAASSHMDSAEESFRRAIQLDPRFYQGRFAYAQWLLSKGDRDGAARVLEEGLRHWHLDEGMSAYYLLAAQLREEKGDKSGAEVLRRTAMSGHAQAKQEPRSLIGSEWH